MKKPYRCIVCGKRIPAARVKACLSAKVLPRYCSDRCANTAGRQRWRARKAKKERTQ